MNLEVNHQSRKRLLEYKMETKKFRILALDGGGSKGVYTLGVLRELEMKFVKEYEV